MSNARSSKITRLLNQVRGLVSVDTSMQVGRRNLNSSQQSEVQLELDLGRGFRITSALPVQHAMQTKF